MDNLLVRGIEEFNRQYFFEAHDLWEKLWNETSGEDRLFYQALIQTAVGFHHLTNGNAKGACSQFGKALRKLDRYVPCYQGIDTARLVEHIRSSLLVAEEMRTTGTLQSNVLSIPTIECC
ncbi:MAG: DUF309 domain-containing protein [Ignavibacteria bacterium]